MSRQVSAFFVVVFCFVFPHPITMLSSLQSSRHLTHLQIRKKRGEWHYRHSILLSGERQFSWNSQKISTYFSLSGTKLRDHSWEIFQLSQRRWVRKNASRSGCMLTHWQCLTAHTTPALLEALWRHHWYLYYCFVSPKYRAQCYDQRRDSRKH